MTLALAEAAATALLTVQIARKEAFIGPLHTQLYRIAGSHFEKQADALALALRKRASALNEAVCRENLLDDIPRILAPIFADYAPEMVDHMVPVLQRAMGGGITQRLTDFGVTMSFDLRSPLAVDYLEKYAMQQVTKIDATTMRSMQKIVTWGVTEGKSYTEMANRMVAKFAEFGTAVPQKHLRNRAELIATYEIGMAYESGSRQAVEALAAKGLPIQKRWLTVGDDRVEETCLRNEAEKWIPLKQPHRSGHQQPLAHPACRCGELYQLDSGAMARALRGMTPVITGTIIPNPPAANP